MDYTTHTHTHSFTLFRSGFFPNLLKVVRGLLGLYFSAIFFFFFWVFFTCAQSKNDLYL